MIYTSYFAQLRNLPDNVIPISICGKAPEFYKGLQYKKVAPKYGFFMEWKKNHDNDFYIEHYNDEVLSKLNPYGVVLELYDLLSDEQKQVLKSEGCQKWHSQKIHIALICYEKPSDFCHRHLLAKWFTARDRSDCKLYFQQKGVTYADYKPNKWYISPFEVCTLEEIKAMNI